VNKAAFYAALRPLFGGRLTQAQVDGIEAILAAWDAHGALALASPVGRQHLAYVLATAKHETAHTMQPIREYGRGRGRPYGKPAGPYGHAYYGRGFVQLTWLDNYRRAGEELGRDFVRYPDAVMEPDNAAAIIVRGMRDGWFTGKALHDYIHPGRCDYYNARKIVNGLDRARAIADLADAFQEALDEAEATPERPAPADIEPIEPRPPRPLPTPTALPEAEPVVVGEKRAPKIPKGGGG